jgi:hypothetical protein
MRHQVISPVEVQAAIEAKIKVKAAAQAKAKAKAGLKAKAEAEANLRPPLPLVLPRISLSSFRATPERFLEESARALFFSPRVIAWALQTKQPLREIQTYISHFDADTVSGRINEPIACVGLAEAIPILSFAVEHGSLDLIRSLLKAGANVGARSSRWQMPVLAYAVLLYDVDKRDTTEVFKLLLALGANPNQIPQDMWLSFVDAPKSKVTSTTNRQEWCEAEIRNNIAFNLNLSQRYFVRILLYIFCN